MLIKLKEGRGGWVFVSPAWSWKPAFLYKATRGDFAADGHLCVFNSSEQLCTACATLQCKYCVVTGDNNDRVNLCRQDACWKAPFPQVSWWISSIMSRPMIYLKMALEPLLFCMRTTVRSALEASVGYYCLKERRKQNSNSLGPLCGQPIIQENQRLTYRGHGFNKPVCKCWLSWTSYWTLWLFWSLTWTATKGDGLTVCRQSLFP